MTKGIIHVGYNLKGVAVSIENKMLGHFLYERLTNVI